MRINAPTVCRPPATLVASGLTRYTPAIITNPIAKTGKVIMSSLWAIPGRIVFIW